MKKRIIIIIILLLIIIAGGVAFYMYQKSNNKQQNIDDNKEHQIMGIITDGTMATISIRDKSNSVYTFSIENADKTDVEEILIGDYATVTYRGALNTSVGMQTVEVTKLSVKAAVSTSNNTIPDNKTADNTQSDKDTYENVINDNGIFKSYYEQAYEKMKSMTLDEKVGQLFLVRVPESEAAAEVSKYQFGGYILFGRDTSGQTKDSLTNIIKSYQDSCKIPMLIATDEEGGTVVRVSSNKNLAESKFQSPQKVYANGGFEAVREDTITKNNLLASLGINVNLAPDSDVSTSSSDYIYKRAFGKDGAQTAEFVKTVVEASKTTATSDVLKHFPGYGNNKDTHTGISIDERSLDSFRESDFLPFKAGIQSGAEAILVSHNIIVNVENNVPASLSPNIHNILRNELGFTGIVMTDDLAMDAIKDYFSKPSVQALKAGNDMIIITDYKGGIQDIKDALSDGELSESIIDQAVTRILAWKYYKKMM